MKRERYFEVEDAAGTRWLCRGSDLGEMLAALPGWRGFRRVLAERMGRDP